MRTHNWHPKLIEQYLTKYYSVPESRDAGRVYLKHFFTTMNEDPAKFIKRPKKEIIATLWDYTKAIDKRPPKTQNSMLSFVKKFLVRSKIDIPEVEWEDMRIRNHLNRGTRPLVKKKTPTTAELKKILSYATGIKAKALFTLCASSGMRIDEALSLTWDDIDLERRQIGLQGDNTKGKYDRVTFFTPECKELLELWKPERERMLQSVYKKSKYLRSKLERMGYEVTREKRCKGGERDKGYYWFIRKDGRELTKEEIIALDGRVFPFDYVMSNRLWIGLLERAGPPFNGIDVNPRLKDRKYFYNIHCLRRFWFTQLTGDRANDEYVNFMGGHISLLDQSYKDVLSNDMIERFKQEYDKHLGCLTIFEAGPDMTEISSKVEALEREMARKDKQIQDLMVRLLTTAEKSK